MQLSRISLLLSAAGLQLLFPNIKCQIDAVNPCANNKVLKDEPFPVGLVYVPNQVLSDLIETIEIKDENGNIREEREVWDVCSKTYFQRLINQNAAFSLFNVKVDEFTAMQSDAYVQQQIANNKDTVLVAFASNQVSPPVFARLTSEEDILIAQQYALVVSVDKGVVKSLRWHELGCSGGCACINNRLVLDEVETFRLSTCANLISECTCRLNEFEGVCPGDEDTEDALAGQDEEIVPTPPCATEVIVTFSGTDEDGLALKTGYSLQQATGAKISDGFKSIYYTARDHFEVDDYEDDNKNNNDDDEYAISPGPQTSEESRDLDAQVNAQTDQNNNNNSDNNNNDNNNNKDKKQQNNQQNDQQQQQPQQQPPPQPQNEQPPPEKAPPPQSPPPQDNNPPPSPPKEQDQDQGGATGDYNQQPTPAPPPVVVEAPPPEFIPPPPQFIPPPPEVATPPPVQATPPAEMTAPPPESAAPPPEEVEAPAEATDGPKLGEKNDKKCESPDGSCTVCGGEYFVLQASGTDKNSCYPCPENCSDSGCNDYSGCQQCKPGYVRLTDENTGANLCYKCPENCLECSDVKTCYRCDDESGYSAYPRDGEVVCRKCGKGCTCEPDQEEVC